MRPAEAPPVVEPPHAAVPPRQALKLEPPEEEVPAAAPVRGQSAAQRFQLAADAVARQLPRHGRAMLHARVVGFREGAFRIHFPPEAGLHRMTVFGGERARIEELMSAALGTKVALQEEADPDLAREAAPSAAEATVKAEADRERAVDAQVRAHPAVRAILQVLGGAVEHVRVLEPEHDAPGSTPGSAAAPEDEGA